MLLKLSAEHQIKADGNHCTGQTGLRVWPVDGTLRRSGCFPAEPCPPERRWSTRQGQAVIAGLFEALQIFPAVVGQLVFAVPLPACDHVPHESPSGGTPTSPVESDTLWQSGVAEERSQFSLSSN